MQIISNAKRFKKAVCNETTSHGQHDTQGHSMVLIADTLLADHSVAVKLAFNTPNDELLLAILRYPFANLLKTKGLDPVLYLVLFLFRARDVDTD